MERDPQPWMSIGRVAGPFGIRGEIKVEPYTDEPVRFKAISELYTEEGDQRFELESARVHKGHVLVKLAGIDAPEQVEPLRGRELLIPREQAAPLPAGHFFLEDVIGVSAYDANGQCIGQVTDILRTGANEVFVIRGDGAELLVPSTRDAVRELDLSARTLVVEPWVLEAPA